MSEAVRAGQVFVDCDDASAGVELPFNGTKRSGHVPEKGLLPLDEVRTTKTVVQYHA